MIPKHVFMIKTSLFLDTKPKADDGQRSQGGALHRRDAVRRRRHTTICYYMELQGGSTNLIILEAKGRSVARFCCFSGFFKVGQQAVARNVQSCCKRGGAQCYTFFEIISKMELFTLHVHK